MSVHQLQIRLTDEQFELLNFMATQEGQAIEDVIPAVIDEYIDLVHRMEALSLLPGSNLPGKQ